MSTGTTNYKYKIDGTNVILFGEPNSSGFAGGEILFYEKDSNQLYSFNLETFLKKL